MQYLTGREEQDAIHWITQASIVAQKALCLRARCGTVIVNNGKIIGEGYNAPPLDDIDNRKCDDNSPFVGKPKYDHTCCMHAEWRAILDVLRKNKEEVTGSQLFFTRIDSENQMRKSGKPLCTVCSRFALDVGIRTFTLWHDDGICTYNTDEYNTLSYNYIHKT